MSHDEPGLIDSIPVDHAIGLYRAKVEAMNGAPSSDAMFDIAALAVNIAPVLIGEIEALRGDLAAKGSDFDAAVRKIGELRDEVADFQAACKSACEQRDDQAARVTALQAAVDSRAGWRPPARETTDPDALPPGSIVLRDGVAWHRDATHWHLICGGHARWDRPFGSDPITVLYVPTEEATDE